MDMEHCVALEEILPPERRIVSLDPQAIAHARARIDAQCRPVGSLGVLEEIACRLAAMRWHCEVMPARLFTIAGDNGVSAENVSAFPQEVTRQLVYAFLRGGAAVNALAKEVGMEQSVVDAGCVGGPFPAPVVNLRLGEGTGNIARGPAMSLETCLEGLRNGASLALEAVDNGDRCLAIGEMGIANTTTAAALCAHLLSLPVSELVGPGSGVGHEVIAHKADVVRRALLVNSSGLASGGSTLDPVHALACLSGFEIVTMAGVVLGGAAAGVPVLVDGFISTAAFAAAALLCPAAADYCFISHTSAEPGHALVLNELARRLPHPRWQAPLLSLGLRLGEGTGCALAWPLLRCAARLYCETATFAEAGVSESIR